ncbi:MAG: hypothetical protein RL021_39 [Bacteroidota bacterium]|jgi:PAS domain S-box-containing protein
MVNDSHELERLKAAYEQLQLRVTRFSAVEQELINTRDLLDHELEMYKRLHLFNRSAIVFGNKEGFIALIAEAIIDIFELEASIVYIERKNDTSEFRLYTEGLSDISGQEATLINDIHSLTAHLVAEHRIVLEEKDLESSRLLNSCLNGLAICLKDPDSDLNIHLIGLITRKNAPLYNKRHSSRSTIFSVFAHQVQALIANRLQQLRITEQIRQIKASDLELKKLSLIATRTKNGVIITDSKGCVEWVNESFEQTSGWKLEEIKGKKPKDFLQRTGSDPAVLEKLREALQRKENVEVTIINYHKDGHPYYNQLEITPVFDEEGNHINFIALQKDITSETMFRQEILRINSRFEIITSKSNIGIWEFQPKTGRLIWNDVLKKQYGITSDFNEQELYRFWENSIHPHDRKRIVDEVEELYTSDREMIEQEFRILRKDINDIRMLSCLVIAERDQDHNLTRIFGTSIDVTESRNAEQKLMLKNDELKKINAELDNFVYSISHDLRSPLLSINGILSLLKDDREISAKSRHYIDLAASSTDRLDITIQEILDYSRNARLELRLTEFDLKKVITEIFNDLRFSSPNMDLRLMVQGEPMVRSDQYRLTTVLKNVIGNAVKYRRTDIPLPFVDVCLKTTARRIELEVRDNGQGIPAGNLPRIFEMFFRGKSETPGTGLGLYICKEIINKLNGYIEVESVEKEGTCVRMTIPIPEHPH